MRIHEKIKQRKAIKEAFREDPNFEAYQKELLVMSREHQEAYEKRLDARVEECLVAVASLRQEVFRLRKQISTGYEPDQ